MINRGKDTFTRFLSSCYLTDNKDVCLLATYTSSVEDNYKVISVLNNQGITTYMAITDNDKYPIILSKKDTSFLLYKMFIKSKARWISIFDFVISKI